MSEPQVLVLHWVDFGEGDQRLGFHCPGCDEGHYVRVRKDGVTKSPHWSWNQSMDKPTFQPSILVTGGPQHKRTICHSFVTDGVIKFLADCTHKLAEQEVAIPPYDPDRDW